MQGTARVTRWLLFDSKSLPTETRLHYDVFWAHAKAMDSRVVP